MFRQQKGKLGTAQSHLTALQRMNQMDRYVTPLGCYCIILYCTVLPHTVSDS